MHTAICAFDDRSRAEQAVDRLVRSGFARHDVHIEHERAAAEPPARDAHGDVIQRDVADRGVLSSFGAFFASLLGRDNPSGHVDTYSHHVERGSYVVVVDGHDAGEAQRARTLLQDLQGSDLDVVHREGQRPLRDLVAQRGDPGTAGMVARSRESYEGTGAAAPVERDRAMAANAVSPTTGPALRDPEVEHAPGLRYADKDKPF
jgi:hypothetical protein